MSLEGWKTFFETGGVILLFLTFVFGTGAVLTGKRINALQAERTLTLEADAANAKASQQRVETDLAKQQERAAKAEKDLLELQQRIKPRHLSAEQESRLTEALKAAPIRGLVEIMCILGDGEGKALSVQLDGILKVAGWETTGVSQGIFSPANPVGMGIVVHSRTSAPPYAAALQHAFVVAGMPIAGAEEDKLPEGKVRLTIGIKPDNPN